MFSNYNVYGQFYPEIYKFVIIIFGETGAVPIFCKTKNDVLDFLSTHSDCYIYALHEFDNLSADLEVIS